MSEITEIPIGKIKVGEHDQRLQIDDESLDGLVTSIRRVGIIYPLVVSPLDDGFVLVEGHRRLAACKRMDKQTVPCVVESSGGARVAEVAFAGNFFRKELSPVEQAAAIAEAYKSERMTIEQLASGFDKTKHWVQSQIAICDWPPDVLEAIHYGSISVSAASNLACVTDDTYRRFLIENAVDQGATARTTAAWLQAFRSMRPPEQAIEAEPVPGSTGQAPAIPQVPCFFCGQVHLINEVSHVPLCGTCIKRVRAIS